MNGTPIFNAATTPSLWSFAAFGFSGLRKKRSLMKLSRRWLRLLGCSSWSPPLMTSTSLGILCIKHGNHAVVSTSIHLPGTYSMLGFVLGCEHII